MIIIIITIIDETVKHVISVCPILAKEQYINRHDRVCAQLHVNKCKEMGIKLDNRPKSVEISHEGKVTTAWNQYV